MLLLTLQPRQTTGKLQPTHKLGRITMFSLEDCSHCRLTKAAFIDRRILYLDINLTLYPQKRKDRLSLTDRLTVPQVFLNETYIGCAAETMKLLQT
jgi:glutaredoxin